jgi:periplasmic protein CpxP/Spy
MKTRSIFAIVALFLLAMTVNSFAQMGGNPQERLKKTLEDYKTRLKLTDVQFGKIDTILTAQMSEMSKIRESAGEDREAMRAAFMELREKTNKQIEALLTDDQKIEWKKIQEEMAQRRQGGGRG